MKTSCTCGWVGVGEAPWIDIRARGWDIDGDVRSRQELPLLGHTGRGGVTRVAGARGAQDGEGGQNHNLSGWCVDESYTSGPEVAACGEYWHHRRGG